jgi:hypothetical protein
MLWDKHEAETNLIIGMDYQYLSWNLNCTKTFANEISFVDKTRAVNQARYLK